MTESEVLWLLKIISVYDESFEMVQEKVDSWFMMVRVFYCSDVLSEFYIWVGQRGRHCGPSVGWNIVTKQTFD